MSVSLMAFIGGWLSVTVISNEGDDRFRQIHHLQCLLGLTIWYIFFSWTCSDHVDAGRKTTSNSTNSSVSDNMRENLASIFFFFLLRLFESFRDLASQVSFLTLVEITKTNHQQNPNRKNKSNGELTLNRQFLQFLARILIDPIIIHIFIKTTWTLFYYYQK